MQRMLRPLALLFLLTPGCATRWVLQDPPGACRKMCESWQMDVGAIVGVGDQNPYSQQGATACVCTPKGQKSTAIDAQEMGVAALTAIPDIKRQKEEDEQRPKQALPHMGASSYRR